MARPAQRLSPRVRPDVVRTAHKTEGHANDDKGEGEGNEGREGSRAPGTLNASEGGVD